MYDDLIESNEYMMAICEDGLRDARKAIRGTYLFQGAFGLITAACGVATVTNWPKLAAWINLVVGLVVVHQGMVWMPNYRNIYRNWEVEWGQKLDKHRFLLALLYAGEIEEYLNETANGF